MNRSYGGRGRLVMTSWAMGMAQAINVCQLCTACCQLGADVLGATKFSVIYSCSKFVLKNFKKFKGLLQT